MTRLFLTALATSVALFAGIAQARDGNVPGTASQAKQGAQGLTFSAPHKLQKTYLETGNPVSAVVAGFNPYGSAVSVNCTVTAGCTIEITANAQLGNVASENATALCPKVDGAYLSCPYNKIYRPGSGFEVMTYQTFVDVPLGTHTVEMEVYSSQPTSLYRFNTEVQLYK
jgi:hypothetical protein